MTPNSTSTLSQLKNNRLTKSQTPTPQNKKINVTVTVPGRQIHHIRTVVCSFVRNDNKLRNERTKRDEAMSCAVGVWMGGRLIDYLLLQKITNLY